MRYFAYGSNLDVEQMARRCPGARLVGPAVLDGYRLGFTVHSELWEGGVADIVAAPGARVHGVLWDLNDEQLAALDRYEQVPVMYRRVRVSVGGESVWTYEVVEKRPHVAPSARYRDVIVRAARAHGFPAAYVDAIGQVAV